MDAIECSLTIVSFEDKPQFAALSYVWGDASITQTIQIHGPMYLSAIPRSSSCAGSIRKRTSSSLGWVLRDDQIMLGMRVLTLLARETEDLLREHKRLNVEWMRKHSALCRDEHESHLGNKYWRAVEHFWVQPYWRRMWVFQEVLLGRNGVVITHGLSSLSYRDLEVASAWLLFTESVFDESVQPRPEFVDDGVWRTLIEGRCQPFPVRSFILGRSIMKKDDTRPHWDIFPLINHRQATDPRDHIYGVLGVGKFTNIVPGYRKSLWEVYHDYASAVLKETARGDWLSFAGVGIFSRDPDLPSWAPNYPMISRVDGNVIQSFHDLSNADRGLFQALAKGPALLGFTMMANAVMDPRVAAVQEAFSSESLLDGRFLEFYCEYLSRHGTYVTGIHPLEVLFRILQNWEGPPRDEWPSNVFYERAFAFNHAIIPLPGQQAGRLCPLSKPAEEFIDINTGLFMAAFWPYISAERLHTDRTVANSEIRKIVRRFDALEPFYRFFEAGNGYLGLVPKCARPGDIISVIQSCNSLLVLRKEGDHYLLIGSCWVLGMMEGLMAQLLETGEATIERIKIW